MPAGEGYAHGTLSGVGTVGRFDALASVPGMVHAVTTARSLDPDLVKNDRAAAARVLADGLGLCGVAVCHQVHGGRVVLPRQGGIAGEADALATDRPGLGVMAISADCPLVLVADRHGRAAGVAHASWRSTVKGITGRLIDTMRHDLGCDPGELIACICPSVGPCCYEVGQDVLHAAKDGLGGEGERFFTAKGGGKYYLDLWAANAWQLRSAGVQGDSIHCGGVCTICSGDLYCSYRRDGDAAGRFAAVIGLCGDEETSAGKET
ncbi:MAG: polyphenol oxidase family protein [Phycisphaerae bacterium]